MPCGSHLRATARTYATAAFREPIDTGAILATAILFRGKPFFTPTAAAAAAAAAADTTAKPRPRQFLDGNGI